ncbi:hypothetical protein PVK06_045278 [Gossypium arboreum]|uniref:Uncharacterized protein n=1 Tax=Gossypium arboreum TaxID=29729 RepID=A0ABR0MTU8_GOSAR|nr:hypothetical protein PVK06_045278 [Gossypium arboreum]
MKWGRAAGVAEGLHLTWQQGYRPVELEVQQMLGRQWTVEIRHVLQGSEQGSGFCGETFQDAIVCSAAAGYAISGELEAVN